MSIRVTIVDDHAQVRRGLCSLLKRHADLEVVGEAADGAEAARGCLAWKPDVVTMDVQMPVVNGVEATRQIRALLPQVHVLAVSGNSDGHRATEMLAAGASGYVLKDCLFEQLADAVRGIAGGGVFLSDPIAEKLIAMLRATGLAMTSEEASVLRRLARGRNRIEVARDLDVTTDAITQTWQAVMARSTGTPLEPWFRQAWTQALCIR